MGLEVEVESATEAPTPGLRFGGWKVIALPIGCKSNVCSSLDAVFFARRSVPTAM